MPRTSPLGVDVAHDLCARRLRALHAHAFVRGLRIADVVRARAVTVTYLWLEVLGPSCLPRPRGHAADTTASHLALDRWLDAAQRCRARQPRPDVAEELALADAFASFDLPVAAWEREAQALRRAASAEPVRDLAGLVEDARGLGSAPAGVFLRIVASRHGVRRYHLAPSLDPDELAHDLGVFAYTVQVMADVFANLGSSSAPHTALPREILERYRLNAERLVSMRDLNTAPTEFLGLMNDLTSFARRFHQSGLAKLAQAAAYFPPEAVGQLDQLLSHYVGVLRGLKEAEFAPCRFPRPRVPLGRSPVNPGPGMGTVGAVIDPAFP